MDEKEKFEKRVENHWSFLCWYGGKPMTQDESDKEWMDMEDEANEKHVNRYKILLERINAGKYARLDEEKMKKIEEGAGKESDILIEDLKKHFYFKFFKDGDKFETLMTLLKQENDSKFFAMIASEIYNSKYFIRSDFKTFAKWYREFCRLVKCKCVEDYKPSKLKPDLNQAATFGFLHI